MKNWNNIDLDSHEIDSALIDEFTFEDLLLMINCNLPQITEYLVRKEFYKFLNDKVQEVKEVFESNLTNIVKHAKEERNEKV